MKLSDFTDVSIDYTQLLNHAFTFSVGAFVGAYLRQLGLRRQAKRESRHGSSLATHGRTISIVTTAALPWRTGTSVNPLLRAAHLANDSHRKVLLVVPWLEPEEQELLYPKGMVFKTKEEQAEYILSEGRKRTSLPCKFTVLFWDGKYFAPLGSIFPISDITAVIPQHDADVAILEEPEHLNWFQHTTRWTDKFKHVVGIMHTNYLAYVRGGKRRTTGVVNAAACSRINKWVCRIHCHKVIKLSDAVQNLPRQVTCNVHGVGGGFIDIGRAKAKAPEPRFTKGAYFIGKAVWGKGYHELISLMAGHQKLTGESVPLDVYGSGEDLAAIKAEAEAYGVNLTFHDGRDHADEELQDYQLFINPCTSDVVATTTAEALASGKWVLVEDLPCNTFFAQFPNCLMYTDAAEFSEKLEQALATEPARMDDETLGKLSWEAATERLLEVSEIKATEWPTPAEEQYASTLWTLYRSVVGFKALREALGIDTVTDEEPIMEDGGQFDQTEVEWLFR